MFKHVTVGLSVVALGLIASSTWAATPPATSLNNCQNAMKAATKAFIANKVMAIGTCLQAVSTQIVKNNAPNAAGAGHPLGPAQVDAVADRRVAPHRTRRQDS